VVTLVLETCSGDATGDPSAAWAVAYPAARFDHGGPSRETARCPSERAGKIEP
jgi:hypothetical protein